MLTPTPASPPTSRWTLHRSLLSTLGGEAEQAMLEAHELVNAACFHGSGDPYVAWRLQELTCDVILHAVPAEFQPTLALLRVQTTHAGVDEVLHALQDQALQVARKQCETEPPLLDRYRHPTPGRALCPLCGDTGRGNHGEGFAVPGGLANHFDGARRAHQCVVMQAGLWRMQRAFVGR